MDKKCLYLEILIKKLIAFCLALYLSFICLNDNIYKKCVKKIQYDLQKKLKTTLLCFWSD